MTRILIVGASPIIFAGLESLLEKWNEEIVVEDSTLPDSSDWLDDDNRWDLMLLYDKIFGIKIRRGFLTNIKRTTANRIIIFGNFTTPSQILEFYHLGIAGYLNEDADITTILNCIQSVIRGKKYISEEMTNYFIGKLVGDRTRVPKKKLTARQEEVALRLIDGQKNTLIASTLSLSESTISAVKRSILRKTGTSNVIELKEFMEKDELNYDLLNYNTRKLKI